MHRPRIFSIFFFKQLNNLKIRRTRFWFQTEGHFIRFSKIQIYPKLRHKIYIFLVRYFWILCLSTYVKMISRLPILFVIYSGIFSQLPKPQLQQPLISDGWISDMSCEDPLKSSTKTDVNDTNKTYINVFDHFVLWTESQIRV